MEWALLGDLRCIGPFTETLHYALPKLLLVASALHEGVQRQGSPVNECPDNDNRPTGAHEDGRIVEIPPGIAAGTLDLPMVAPGEATDELEELFTAIARRHGHPLVTTEYRALGHWPAFLRAAWLRTAPRVGSVAYEGRKRQLVVHALDAVHGLPLAGLREAAVRGLTTEQRAEVRGILAAFRFEPVPALLLDVSLIRALLSGPDAARSSRFSARFPQP